MMSRDRRPISRQSLTKYAGVRQDILASDMPLALFPEFPSAPSVGDEALSR